MTLPTGLPDLLERLSTETILADGAMGTMLHARGVGFDKCFDELNLTHPSEVAGIHRAYIEAGAQLIISNTFGANRFKVARKDAVPCFSGWSGGRGSREAAMRPSPGVENSATARNLQ